MNPGDVSADLKVLRNAVAVQRYSIIGLVGALILSLLITYSLTGRERTVLVPPVIEKSFWVSHDHVSASYLEQMAAFISYLTLDADPVSLDWKRTLLLQYVTPSNAPEFESRQKIEGDRLRALNASTQFAISGLTPNESDMTVLMRGRLATYVNGLRTTEVNKSYLLSFSYATGRIQLNKFEEIVDDGSSNAK